MYLVQDLQEEILLRLPIGSVVRFKAVSPQWKSILESSRFAERRRIMNNLKKIGQILAVRDHQTETESQFQGDEEVEMVYLECEAAVTHPSLTYDGLICIPLADCVNVLNPCTGQVLSFPSGPNPVDPDPRSRQTSRGLVPASWKDFFPGYWQMGFGKDKVNGSYKIVRLFYDTDQSQVLDLNIGEWRKLPNPAPYDVETRKHSVCVNGSIYWFQLVSRYSFTILALDLHTEQFRHVPTPPLYDIPSSPLVNLEDRLAIVSTDDMLGHWKRVIWSMDTQEETWTKTYSIPYFTEYPSGDLRSLRCNPLLVSMQGNLYFHDCEKRLFKYYPETDQLRCIAKHFRLLSPFVDDMVPLRHQEIVTYPPEEVEVQDPDSWISKAFRRIDLSTTVLFTTSVVALLILRSTYVSSRSLC